VTIAASEARRGGDGENGCATSASTAAAPLRAPQEVDEARAEAKFADGVLN
jgi:hypothetical protein